ncbi:MAG: hypothetical protein VCB77_06505 [Alphaproteobacteria bacterium]
MRPFEFISGRGSATVVLVALAATCMLSGCAAAALIPEAAR